MVKKSLISLTLRFSTVAVKFFFLLYFTKELPTSDLGIYGLFVITVSLITYMIGLDFYNYAMRELLKSKQPLSLIANQSFLHIVSYTLLIPLTLLIFGMDLLPRRLIWFFVILSISEHLSQEIHRILVTFTEPIKANIILFIRNGLWVFLIILISIGGYLYISLDNVLLFWLCGSIISVLLGVFFIYQVFQDVGQYRVQIDKKWILEGIKISMFFFGTSLLLKGIEFSDRYFIKYFYTDEVVGIYTFYFSISNVLNTFVVTGIFSLLAPLLIKAFQEGNYKLYESHLRRLTIATIISILVISACIIFFLDYLLVLIKKDELLANKSLLYYLMAYNVVFLLGLIPQYELYVRRKDKLLFFLNLPAFLICIILNLLLVPKLGAHGAAISTLVSFLVLSGLKYFFAIKFRFNER